ncbi:hypothetical protein M0802_006192 [Mischocyttarus mexicanus]|nr:hypothetical protein M0802_006192 [Mischocyttarus mexicanus]
MFGKANWDRLQSNGWLLLVTRASVSPLRLRLRGCGCGRGRGRGCRSTTFYKDTLFTTPPAVSAFKPNGRCRG